MIKRDQIKKDLKRVFIIIAIVLLISIPGAAGYIHGYYSIDGWTGDAYEVGTESPTVLEVSCDQELQKIGKIRFTVPEDARDYYLSPARIEFISYEDQPELLHDPCDFEHKERVKEGRNHTMLAYKYTILALLGSLLAYSFVGRYTKILEDTEVKTDEE